MEIELKFVKEVGKLVLIFLYYLLYKIGFIGMDLIKLINEGDFYDLVECYGNVCYIFVGYVYCMINGLYCGIFYFIFKSLVY